MRRRFASILAVLLALIVAALVEFVVTPGLAVAVVFAVPVVLAARFCSARIVLAVGLVAVVLDVFDSTVAGATSTQLVVRAMALSIILILAVQVATLRERERQRTHEAEAAREQLREFVSLVVHDLKGPLTVAMGYLQLVQRRMTGSSDDQFRSPVDKTERALQRILRLVNDLLDTARLERGRFVIQAAPCDLAALTRDIVEDQRRSDPSHHYVLDVPAHVVGTWDNARLQQVLTNLISNAAKFSAGGTDIRVQIQSDEKFAVLAVADRGAGIAPAEQEQLFQPFARLGREREATGTGLGLYISKGIVEAHGGRIWVDSAVGRGSTFYVRLPRALTAEPAALSPDLAAGEPR